MIVPLNELDFLKRALGAEIEADGHIDLGPFEIPSLGTLTITLPEGGA